MVVVTEMCKVYGERVSTSCIPSHFSSPGSCYPWPPCTLFSLALYWPSLLSDPKGQSYHYGGGVGDLRLLMPGVQSTWHQDCLLRSMLPHWCLSVLIFWPSPTPYHWSVNFVPGLAPLGLSGKHTEISVSDEQEQDLAIMFEPLSKTKIECTLLATQVHGPLRPPPHCFKDACTWRMTFPVEEGHFSVNGHRAFPHWNFQTNPWGLEHL